MTSSKEVHLYILMLFICLMAGKAGAQFSIQSSLSMVDLYNTNPAYGGMGFSLEGNLGYRRQWDLLPDSPKSFTMNLHAPLYKIHGGVGTVLTSVRSGAFSFNTVKFSYNYITDINIGLLSIGGRVGIGQMSISGDHLITPQGNYETGVNHNDPILPNVLQSGVGFISDIGLFFRNKKIKAGISIVHLPNSNIQIGNINMNIPTYENIFFEYKILLASSLIITPSARMLIGNGKVQSDIFLGGIINGNIFGGIGVRGYNSNSLDALNIIFGMRLDPRFTLYYGYDIGLSALKEVHSGSHEIILNYNLRREIGKRKKISIYYNPRYL